MLWNRRCLLETLDFAMFLDIVENHGMNFATSWPSWKMKKSQFFRRPRLSAHTKWDAPPSSIASIETE